MVKSESKTKKCQLMYNSKGRKKERKKKEFFMHPLNRAKKRK